MLIRFQSALRFVRAAIVSGVIGMIAADAGLVVSAEAQILSAPLDSDGEGVPNSQEAHDGTNPASADSLIEHAGSTYCVNWNGFLSDRMQVFELRNAGCSTLGLELSLRSSTGAVLSTLSRTLAPSQQTDVVANQLTGFLPSTYGTLCATIQTGDPDTLDARLSTYALLGTNSFTDAFSNSAATARAGSQYIGYNHFFPTLVLAEQSKTVQGWIQVSSDEATVETGELVYFSATGTELKRVAVSLSGYGRFDSDTHSVGANTVGFVEWRPTDSSKKFRLTLNRYYLTGAPGSAIAGIVSVPARRPSGKLSAAIFRTDSRIAVLELSNVLGSSVTVTATVANPDGTATSTQPAAIVIPAKGTYHLVLNDYLSYGGGMVQFSADQPQSLVSTVLEYRVDNSGRFADVFVGEPKAGFGVTERSSYNNFLGGCTLRLANLANSASSTQIDLKRYDGTTVPFSSPVQVPANGIVSLDLCSADAANNYGGVTLTPVAPETIVADVVRLNADGSSEFRTSATERSICSAGLVLNTPAISLTASSGTPGTVTVTNTSSFVATGIQATLPSGWGDVTANSSACASLAPNASCLVSFLPGASTHAAASISIVGTNTNEVLPTVTVNAAPTAVLSVSGSPLALTIGGASGILTITNTSTTVTAIGIGSSFTGTALDGLVTETGNSCAALAPLASCTLTFTPGGSTVSSTSFPISGSNTNTATGSISVQSGSTLTVISPNSGAASGGTGVTLSGTGLTGATGVTFGGIAATAVNVINSTTVTAVTPAHAAGAADVTITTPAGGATLTNGYTYLATAVGQSVEGGTIGCLNGGLDNIIAATVDNSSGIVWGGFGSATSAVSIADGAANSTTIVTALGAGSYAAQLCSDYQVDSQGNIPCQAGNTCYSDWFLPASNQLDCLYNNAATIGGFSPTFYWSSTEFISAPTAFAQMESFLTGAQSSVSKAVTLNVRCVRSFVP